MELDTRRIDGLLEPGYEFLTNEPGDDEMTEAKKTDLRRNNAAVSLLAVFKSLKEEEKELKKQLKPIEAQLEAIKDELKGMIGLDEIAYSNGFKFWWNVVNTPPKEASIYKTFNVREDGECPFPALASNTKRIDKRRRAA
jgi:hypothetical protein